jgi:hypothetical protein
MHFFDYAEGKTQMQPKRTLPEHKHKRQNRPALLQGHLEAVINIP